MCPHLGWRQIRITPQRTAVDFAQALRELVDQAFPAAERLVLVLDNLTPVHGSWLNIAELEWSMLSRQCLERRLPTQAVLAAEVAAWVAQRNQAHVRVAWRFTVADARQTLAHVYPIPEPDNGALTDYSA